MGRDLALAATESHVGRDLPRSHTSVGTGKIIERTEATQNYKCFMANSDFIYIHKYIHICACIEILGRNPQRP